MKQALLFTLLFLSLTAFAQNYNAAWEKVFDLESNGQYKKAATAADAIYSTAKKNHNDSQLVKAFFFKSKYLLIHEEDGQYKVITSLQQNIKTASPATGALLQSLYAEMLNTILQDTRYTIARRTPVAGAQHTDYRQWSIKDFEDTILQAYTNSLKNKELLYKTRLSAYDDVIDFSRVQSKIKRSLYDFLAERYMDYAAYNGTFRSKKFGREDLPLLFGKTPEFLMLNTSDTITNLKKVLPLCQEMEAHYLKTGDTLALQMAVLRRIKYADSETTLPEHTAAMLTLFDKLANDWGESPFAYRARLGAAACYNTLASKDKNPGYRVTALALCNRILANNRKHDVAAETINLKNSIIHQKFSMKTERYLMPGKPALATVNFRNLDAVALSFYKIKHGSIPTNTGYNKIDSLPQTRPFLTKTYTLPDPHNHFEYSTEIVLPALEKGTYFIVAHPVNKTDGKITGQNLYNSIIQVSQLSVLSQRVNNTSVFQLADRETGAPVKGVVAIAVKKFVSDENGTITVPKISEKNYYQDIVFYHEGDTLTDNFHNYNYRSNYEPTASAQLYLDRAIYRPGQTVYFKGVLTKGDKGTWSTVPNVFVSVTIENDNNDDIATFRLKTNEFGSFTGECKLPASQTGSFTITVDEDEDMEKDPGYDQEEDEHPFWDNVHFNATDLYFRVEEYKRPTFEITWLPVKEAFKLGDSITVTGKAASYSGAPIAGAKVAYHVKRGYSYNNYRTDNDYDSYRENERYGDYVEEDETTTDAQGNFTITFIAQSKDNDKKAHTTFSYNIVADLKDSNGEARSGHFSVKAGNYPLEVNAWLPDVVVAGETAKVSLTTKNINGNFLPAAGSVAIYKISASAKVFKARPWDAPEIQTIPRAEFEKLFPYLPYEVVKDSVLTDKAWYRKDVNTADATELILKDFKDWPSGEYQLEFTAKDASGFEEKATRNFRLERNDEKIPANGDLFSFRITNKDFIKDGYVAVEVRTVLPAVYATLQAFVNESFTYNKSVVITRNKAVYKIPLVKDAGTLMLVDFGFIWQNSYYHERLTADISVPYTPLTIEMANINSKLLPGSDQKWEVTVKNASKKAEAELLASMYDASLDQFATRSWDGLESYNYRQPSLYVKQLSTAGTAAAEYESLETRADNYVARRDALYMYGFNIIPRVNNYYPKGPKGQRKKGGAYTITGTVTAQDGFALPGANLLISGTSEGTTTDIDGNYILYAAPCQKVIVSYAGFNSASFITAAGGIHNIELEIDSNRLDEVVVVGYGTQKKEAFTGSATKKLHYVTTTTSENSGLSWALRGEVAGVNVIAASGAPGSDATIRIRGFGSVNGTQSALFIIDGVPFSEDAFKDLSEKDILSVQVLKDTAATAIYGSRGANGVVIINTKKALEELKTVKARTNFKETAFFYPQLKTGKKGEVTFSFTTPEALTEWKLRLFAQNKAAVSGYLEKTFFTQKDLMVVPYMPRFLREGDTITLKTKITNLTPLPKSGNAVLQLFNAVSMAEADTAMGNNNAVQPFSVGANASVIVSWVVNVPDGIEGVQYKVLAKSGDYTDGEENILPVLPNRMLVTESIPLWVREHSTKQYSFENLKNNTSNTLKNQSITLEYTSNPAWLALQSLPYLMEYEHECSEQTFARYYANAIAAKIVGSNPNIAGLFDKWRANGTPSKLEQNTELKSIIVAETPWLMDMQSKEEQNKRLALLMDLGKMAQSQEAVIQKFTQKQLPSGGFPWFDGGFENQYITTHILAGFGHLQQLGALPKKDSIAVNGIVKKAIAYTDAGFLKEYKIEYKHLKNNRLDFIQYSSGELHYLYMRSFYVKQFPLNDTLEKAIKFNLAAIKNNWKDSSLYDKALTAVVLHRYGDTETANKVVNWLKGTSATDEDSGMYWVENKPSWYCYQAPVETQAIIIEAFTEIANDTKSVDAMKVWLLKQKQAKNWPTTKSTTEGVYALLMQGSNWLDSKPSTTFTLGDAKVLEQKLTENAPEVETGYLKLQWKPEEITQQMATLTVDNKGDVPGFGGFYWQYFEQLDKIKTAQNGTLNIKKELYLKGSSTEGAVLKPITTQTPLKIGDLVTVRIVLNVTEDTEYVHLKDMRAAGLEPVDVLSGQQYRDGLRYYQSTRDAATHFFFDSINKGTYVLEYEVRVNNAGQFSNGISTIQSMYAPEFSGHTQGIRISAE